MDTIPLQNLLFFSKTHTATSTEQTTFHGASIKISRNTLHISGGECFIQISNIAYVKKGLVATTTRWPIFVIIIAVILAIVLSVMMPVLTILGLAIIGIGVFFCIKLSTPTNHYGLLIGLNSNTAYTFISNNDQVVADAYNFIRKVINGESRAEAQTFNFGTGRGHTPYPTPEEHTRPTEDYHTPGKPAQHPPSIPEYDPKKFIDELLRALDEIQYSNELGDQQKSLLISIMMEAKHGVERKSYRDIDNSRIRFREFAYKTKSSWPKLMASLSARPNLVKFFSSNA